MSNHKTPSEARRIYRRKLRRINHEYEAKEIIIRCIRDSRIEKAKHILNQELMTFRNKV